MLCFSTFVIMASSKSQLFDDLALLQTAISQNNSDIVIYLKNRYEDYLPRIVEKSSGSGIKNKNAIDTKHDSFSAALLPRDIPSNLTPIKATGNGNCLFNSVSLLLTGEENINGILCLLAAAEIYLNKEFYANHPKYVYKI